MNKDFDYLPDNIGSEWDDWEDSFQLIGPRDAAYFLYLLVALCFLADYFGWLV